MAPIEILFLIFIVGYGIWAFPRLRKFWTASAQGQSDMNAKMSMQGNLANGDKVLLSNGQSGTVTAVLPNEVDVALAEGQTFRVNRSDIIGKS